MNTSYAEYRVYQYSVKAKNLYMIDNNAYLITSSLDPVSYVAYHGGRELIKVDLLRSWTCKGHTGNLQGYCPSPYERAKESKNF
jgi:hypothetical protein